MNDRTAVFVRTFPVGKHIVTMTLTRRRFLVGRITCRWAPPKAARLTKEEKRQYRSGRAAAVADAYGSKRGRIGLIIEM
jgi:VanZ family protein